MKKAVSKLRQHFSEHTDDFLFIFGLVLVAFGLLLGALALTVMVSDSAADYLQQLLREKYEVLKTIGFCIAGIVSIWLALAANKRANAMDATAKNTEEGQRQERLKNAIEHLGHDKDSVRMGGAHELFRLAKDTGDLRRTVFDILCAHIRQTTGENKYKEKYETKPSEEVQNLLTLLFTQEPDVFFIKHSINLQGSYLNGATLRQARLKYANLGEVQLRDANLSRAQLQGADLGEAQLQKTFLWEAQLQGANLSNAQLQEAVLWEAQLQRADLSEAELQGADLSGAELQGADLSGAELQGADFSGAELQGADLFKAKLQRVIYKEAKLEGAKFGGAQMEEFFLIEAQSQGAILSIEQAEEASFIKAQRQEENDRMDALLRESDLPNNAASAPDSDKDKGD